MIWMIVYYIDLLKTPHRPGRHQMRRSQIFTSSLSIVALLLVVATGSRAGHVEIEVTGSGNLLTSPVVYSGPIVAGDPLFVGGFWEIIVNDSSWPMDDDKAARWNYIASTYYLPNYDPYLAGWWAAFDENTTGAPVQWRAGRSDVGELLGWGDLAGFIMDFDFDGEIDPDERGFQIFEMQFFIARGTGMWHDPMNCGLGSFTGSSFNPDPANWADDAIEGRFILDHEYCGTPVESVTWGQIKQMYHD